MLTLILIILAIVAIAFILSFLGWMIDLYDNLSTPPRDRDPDECTAGKGFNDCKCPNCRPLEGPHGF